MPKDPLVSRNFVFAFLSFLLTGITFALFIHFPAFLTDLGATESTIGLVLGVGAISSLLVRGMIGRALDTIGRRPLIIAGHIVNVVAAVLHVTVGGIGTLLIVLTLGRGIAEALLFTSLITYSSDVIPESRRTEGMALYGISGQLPLALGGVIGDVILDRWGFTELFIVSGIMAAAALLASLPLQDQRPSTKIPERGGFWRALRSRPMRPLWLVTGVFAIALAGIFLFLRTYLDEIGIGTVGLFFALYSGTAILLRIFARGLPERYGHDRMLVAALGSLAACLGVLAMVSNLPMLAVAGALGGAGHGFLFPILNSLVVTRAPAEDRGAFLSVLVAFFPLGTVLGGPTIGRMIETFGYRAVFLTLGGLVLLTPRLFLVLDRRRATPLPGGL